MPGAYYYFHGNQFERPADPLAVVNHNPSRSVGRVFTNNSGGVGGATGTLIAPRYVLTCAHVLIQGDTWYTGVRFSLAQCGAQCLPYGTSYCGTVWVPARYAVAGAAQNDLEMKAYDFALLQLDTLDVADLAVQNAPAPATLPRIPVDADTELAENVVHATGYVCGKDPPGFLPAVCRDNLWPYTTTASASVQEIVMVTGGGGTILTDVEATKRMSGSPLWTRVFNTPFQIGVLTGSDCTDDLNWAAALTPTTLSWIQAVMLQGSHPEMQVHYPQAGVFDGGGFGYGGADGGYCPQISG